MTKLEIIGAPQSNYVRAIRMVCAEKDVPYDFTPARPHTPEVTAISPTGKIPVMRHGDVSLCESKAIASYIDRTFPGPKLIPDDPAQAAQTEQWVSIINTVVDPVLVRTYLANYVFPKGANGTIDRAAIDASLPAMKKNIDMLDKAVSATGHLAGNSFTLADIVLMPILFYMHRFPESMEMVTGAKNLKAYYDRHATRPSFTSTTPPPPPPKN